MTSGRTRIVIPVTPKPQVSVTQDTFKIFHIPEVCQARHRVTGNEADRGLPCDEYESGNIYCGHTLSKHGRYKKSAITKYNDYKASNGLFIEIDIDDDYSCSVGQMRDFSHRFGEYKYLHQLQNLYFALTGQELEINI